MLYITGFEQFFPEFRIRTVHMLLIGHMLFYGTESSGSWVFDDFVVYIVLQVLTISLNLKDRSSNRFRESFNRYIIQMV